MKARVVVFWAIGPMIAVLLLLAAVAIGFGPGFFTLSIFGAAGFFVATPLLQWALRSSTYFERRPIYCVAFGVGAVLVGMTIAVASGKFFYW